LTRAPHLYERRAFSVIDVAAFSFDKLVIFGVGLIGGSLARALRERGEVAGKRTVIGVGRSSASSERALELGVIDGAAALNDDAALRDRCRQQHDVGA
jgi:prephenate dehydrogenase